MPLEEALGVREGAVLLDVCGSRHQEDLRADLFRLELAGLELRRVLPERGALDLVEVADDEPVQAREREPLQLRVRRANARILTEQEEARDLAVEHVERGLIGGVVGVDPRQVVEAEVVLLGRVFAPERLQLAGEEGVEVTPPPNRAAVVVDVGREVRVLLGVRHRHVAGEDVVEGRHVGRALDRGVAAKGDDAAARAADVPE